MYPPRPFSVKEALDDLVEPLVLVDAFTCSEKINFYTTYTDEQQKLLIP